MKKKYVIAALGLAAALMLGAGQAAFADDTSITYKGRTDQFVYGTGAGSAGPTDLFDGFVGILPGDTVTQNITFTNDSTDAPTVKVYLRAEFPEDKETVAELLNAMDMVVENNGTEISNAPAGELGGLENNVLLGEVASGSTVDLTVDLTVPLTMGNEFQTAAGKVNWIITVEEVSDQPPVPVTGDPIGRMLLIALLVLAGALVLVIISAKRKNRSE